MEEESEGRGGGEQRRVGNIEGSLLVLRKILLPFASRAEPVRKGGAWVTSTPCRSLYEVSNRNYYQPVIMRRRIPEVVGRLNASSLFVVPDFCSLVQLGGEVGVVVGYEGEAETVWGSSSICMVELKVGGKSSVLAVEVDFKVQDMANATRLAGSAHAGHHPHIPADIVLSLSSSQQAKLQYVSLKNGMQSRVGVRKAWTSQVSMASSPVVIGTIEGDEGRTYLMEAFCIVKTLKVYSTDLHSVDSDSDDDEEADQAEHMNGQPFASLSLRGNVKIVRPIEPFAIIPRPAEVYEGKYDQLNPLEIEEARKDEVEYPVLIVQDAVDGVMVLSVAVCSVGSRLKVMAAIPRRCDDVAGRVHVGEREAILEVLCLPQSGGVEVWTVKMPVAHTPKGVAFRRPRVGFKLKYTLCTSIHFTRLLEVEKGEGKDSYGAWAVLSSEGEIFVLVKHECDKTELRPLNLGFSF
uniref:Uncharacterized protein n=1 Tax=Palpitomonas bilix TaxID=652834 RepID=A0A7S3GDX4_9EUKA